MLPHERVPPESRAVPLVVLLQTAETPIPACGTAARSIQVCLPRTMAVGRSAMPFLPGTGAGDETAIPSPPIPPSTADTPRAAHIALLVPAYLAIATLVVIRAVVPILATGAGT